MKLKSNRLNIGILKCHRVPEHFASTHGDYPEMIAKMLLLEDSSLSFTIYNAEQGELPASVHECDAYMITGSRHGVNDEFVWITKLEEFIRQLHVAKKKLIGICFGHQLIAKALGGQVERSSNGWGVGISKNKIEQLRPWMVPSCQTFNLIMSHQDQVTRLPANAVILASNDRCPFYMLQIDNNLTIQGHPELSKEYMYDLIESRKERLNTEEYEAGLQSLKLNMNDQIIASWIINFLQH